MTTVANAGVLVNENFDDGKYSDTGWGTWLQSSNCTTDTTIGTSTSAAFYGTRGLDIHYILDDSPRGDCALHMDNNTSIVRNFSPNLNHYFVRGYVRFPFDSSTMCQSPRVQRKLLYFKPEGWGGDRWAFFVNAWPWSDCETNGAYLSVGYGSKGGTRVTLWGDDASSGFKTADNHLHVNKWYYIEVEAKYGTYGNDTLRLWLAPAGETPKLILDRQNLDLRSSEEVANNVGLGSFELGRQIDIVRTSYSQSVNEHRHWDEVVISTDRVGPINTIRPSSPASLTVK